MLRVVDSDEFDGAPVSERDILAVSVACGDLGPWTARRVGYFSALATTGGLWRFVGGESSCVLKVVQAEQVRVPGLQGDPFDPSSFTFWRREPDVYLRGVTDVLPTGVRMPSLIHRRDIAEERVLLWLEDVSGRHDRDLSDGELGTVARALGRAQALGAAPTGPPWSANTLREIVTPRLALGSRLDDDAGYEHPDLQGVVGEAERAANRRLTEQMPAAMDLLESAPQVLCHHDFWSANIFLQTDGNLVLLDWAHSGPGAIGTDIAVLVSTLIGDRYRPVDAFPTLLAMLTDAYLDGLQSEGWPGDPRLVARSIALATPARFLGAVANLPRLVRDPSLLRLVCERGGWHPSDYIASMARFVVLLDSALDTALQHEV